MQELDSCINLLCDLIKTPSFSNEEDASATIWENWLREKGVNGVKRFHNNIYAVSESFDSSRPTLLLNSHHDTVKPVDSYTRDPFDPEIVNGRLYGLGSNDAGASGVALAHTFIKLQGCKTLPVNLVLAITASEEKMGEYGMRAFLPFLISTGIVPDMAIVGEPTSLQPAIAERGLVVLDGHVEGRAGHAARNEGENAIYRAIEDISILKDFKAPRESDILGPVKVSVTMINAGKQHNIVPDVCDYVVDVRATDAYSNEETVDLLQKAVKWSVLTPRSTRIQASVIPPSHPLVKAAEALGKTPFVSPTTSDMALMHGLPSLKIGPGDSARSHTADEYVGIDEIAEALDVYRRLILSLNK